MQVEVEVEVGYSRTWRPTAQEHHERSSTSIAGGGSITYLGLRTV